MTGQDVAHVTRHTLFTVVHSVESGSPAALAAWRAGAWPIPADSTLPIQHCSTAALSTPALLMAPSIAAAPSCGAVSEDKEPLKPPIGVRTAATMHTSARAAAVARPRAPGGVAPMMMRRSIRSVSSARPADDSPDCTK